MKRALVIACLMAAGAAVTSAPAAEKTDPPQLRITRAKPKMNPAVIRGFEAYRSGDVETAEREYALALKSEPENPDALHGAAAVALRRDYRERAEDLYRRALAANPQDPVAHAGLAGLVGLTDLLATESRLKTVMANQPGHPALHFALGNLHAAAGRWRDARQAYFSACAGAPEQPDYLFNLAVSLDRLRQTALAGDYYRKALGAGKRHAARFDPAHAVARLRELEQ